MIRALEEIIEWRGKPVVIRSDNGPAYIRGALPGWATQHSIGSTTSSQAKTRAHACVGRYNRTVRYARGTLRVACAILFDSIEQVQDTAPGYGLKTTNARTGRLATSRRRRK